MKTRKKKPITLSASEFQIQSAYFSALARLEHAAPELKWIHGSMNGARRVGAAAGKAKSSGLKRGIWDVHIPYARCGHGSLYIEFKAEDGSLSKEQEEFRAALLVNYGHCGSRPFFAVFRDWQKALELTLAYMTGDREKFEETAKLLNCVE